jgi:hypothetical protein
MKKRVIQFGALALALVPGVLAQSTGSYGGIVPETYAITNTSNGALAGVLGNFSTLTIGSGTLATPTVLAFRLRSNAAYRLSANAAVTSGITDGVASGASTTAQAIKTGDIGFRFTAAIDQSGASVVNGGGTPTRTDTITTGYAAAWPSVTDGHTPSFTKTLHDIYGSDIQILSGDRISASGDNSSSDNFLLVTVGIAALPQYLDTGTFSGTVTFTMAAQ